MTTYCCRSRASRSGIPSPSLLWVFGGETINNVVKRKWDCVRNSSA